MFHAWSVIGPAWNLFYMYVHVVVNINLCKSIDHDSWERLKLGEGESPLHRVLYETLPLAPKGSNC